MGMIDLRNVTPKSITAVRSVAPLVGPILRLYTLHASQHKNNTCGYPFKFYYLQIVDLYMYCSFSYIEMFVEYCLFFLPWLDSSLYHSFNIYQLDWGCSPCNRTSYGQGATQLRIIDFKFLNGPSQVFSKLNLRNGEKKNLLRFMVKNYWNCTDIRFILAFRTCRSEQMVQIYNLIVMHTLHFNSHQSRTMVFTSIPKSRNNRRTPWFGFFWEKAIRVQG